MQKWEYLFISCEYYENWRPRYVNGNELDNWRNKPPVHEFSNNLGQEGWELVNIDTEGSGGYTYNYRLVFKRPIQ